MSREGDRMSETRYLSCAETAKLVRRTLKREFPGVKFSVRSKTYSGGASIDVGWTDGPTAKQVGAITGPYAGGRFDGMIDMAYSVQSWLLPDGSAAFGHSPGTGGQRGSDPGYDYEKPHPEAELVDFGANFIFSNRRYSVERERVGRDLCALQQVEFTDLNMRGLCGSGDTQWLDQHVSKLLQRTAFTPGEVYAGVRHTSDGPSVHAWCGIITDFEEEERCELERVSGDGERVGREVGRRGNHPPGFR